MTSRVHVLMLGVTLVPLLVGCCAIPLPLPSITGSGRVVTLDKDITDFDELEVGNAFRVEVRQGDGYRVVIRIDDNLEEYLQLEKQGGTLRIGLEPDRPYNLAQATLEAEITMPELTRLELSGACRGTVEGFQSTKQLEVRVSGASQLRGDIEAGDASVEGSGASQVNLGGSAGDVTLDASGASQLNLARFAVEDAEVEASGASTVSINVGGRLDARASGASRVRYRGEPSLGRIDTSGSSSVERH